MKNNKELISISKNLPISKIREVLIEALLNRDRQLEVNSDCIFSYSPIPTEININSIKALKDEALRKIFLVLLEYELEKNNIIEQHRNEDGEKILLVSLNLEKIKKSTLTLVKK